MPSLLELAGYVQQQGDIGRQRGMASRLGQLASQAYTGPREGRDQLLGQMASVSPEAAASQQKAFRQNDSERMADLSRKAKLFVGMAESGNQQAVAALYPQIAQEARNLGLGDIPLEYNASFLPGLKQFASILDASPNKEALAPRVVGDALVDSTGKVLYRAPSQPEYQWSDTRGVWIPKPGSTMPGGVPTTNPITGTDFGIQETNDYVRSILGRAGVLDSSASPEQLAEKLLPFLIQQESGGNPNAVSPKGAQGLTQVMPATGQDPGFGVRPLQDASPQENVRFGRDYLTAMLRRYPGRPDLALAAYNAGPGVADRFVEPQAAAGGLAAVPVAGVGPKSDAPDETFSQPQSVTFPDGTVRLVQFGNRGSRREVEGVAPPPTDRDAKPPTEGERKAATLLQRLNFSQRQLAQAVNESKEAAAPNVASEIARSLPLVGGVAANYVTPEARQRVEAAQLDILDAALTLGTGAAYTKEQLEGYRRSYFPQIGDSQGTIDDKAARLKNVIEAARIAAGRASPDNQEREQPGRPVRIQSAEDYNRLPAGTLYIAPDGTQRRKR